VTTSRGRLVIVALFALTLVTVRVHAQQPAAPAAGASAPSAAKPAGDAWNFSEEGDEEPSWGQMVRAQAPDMALYAGLTALALVGFFRKSETIKVVTLVATATFLGVFRSQMYSVVNIFGLLSWNLPIFKSSLFMYMFWVVTLGTTVIWGRLYCGRMCAFGAVTQLMDKVVPASWRYHVPVKIERRAVYFKYAFLAAVVAYFLVTRDILIYRYVEPFWMFTLRGNAVMWTGLAILLVATVFVRNLYCRFLCPVGTFLGIISSVTTVFRIKRWSECKSCKICEKTCEWGAIQGPRIVRSECVRCDDCERLYLDEKKCPHWLIIVRKKKEYMARQPPVPTAIGGV